MQGELLTTAHTDALDSCYNQPQPVAEIGQDLDWWQLYYDLRSAGLVAFDDDSTVITITPAGRDYLDAGSQDNGSEADDPEPRNGFDADYVAFLDTFFDEPVPADEVAEWRQDVQYMIGNGHLVLEDGYLHITEAGKRILG